MNLMHSTISLYHQLVVRNCAFERGVGKSDDVALSYSTLFRDPNVLTTPILYSKQDLSTQKVVLLADYVGGSDRIFLQNSSVLYQRPALSIVIYL